MQHNTAPETPEIALRDDIIYCSGCWDTDHLEALDSQLQGMDSHTQTKVFEMSGLACLDTAGAWLLHRTLNRLKEHGSHVEIKGLSAKAQTIFDLVQSVVGTIPKEPECEAHGFFWQIGKVSAETFLEILTQANNMLSFVGRIFVCIISFLRYPHRISFQSISYAIKCAGFDALPIVGLLSFLMGIVITYQGGVQLGLYGAQIYVADLLVVSMFRELAPMFTAIIVAGRTGSAYTAQIGTMQVREEIDAMISIGISPLERLVAPKVIAMTLSLVLLTVYADILGVLGGLTIGGAMLGIGAGTFLERSLEAASLSAYLVGIGKAPVFALTISIIGCYQGFQVSGSAESVGRRTTTSVVQSIFMVIVIDAVFSVLLSRFGV